MFRAGAGWKTLGYTISQVYPLQTHPCHWCTLLAERVNYYTMLKELGPLNLHLNINIGSIGILNLKKYRERIHKTVFPKDSPAAHTVVMDGHSKVEMVRGVGCIRNGLIRGLVFI